MNSFPFYKFFEGYGQISDPYKMFILAAVPILLFFTDLTLKKGFRLSIATAGGDLCLAAINLDLAQLFISMTKRAIYVPELLVILFVIHLFIWVFALRLVISPNAFLTACSYFIGVIAVYSSFLPILYFIIKDR